MEVDFGHSIEYMYKPNSDVVEAVPSMISYCAYIIAAISLIATALVRRKSEVFFSRRRYSRSYYNRVTESFLDTSNNVTTVNQTQFQKGVNKAPYSELSFSAVLKSKIFWLIMMMEVTSVSLSFFLKSAFKDYGSTKFNDD